MKKIRSIAIYLPQFHPIPENDEWWGKGFTEWTNVTKAKPLFKGHYQPQLPTDLGFYDLRLSEVREDQSRLAKEHNIYGFCYYHYWFKGRRLLERPFQEVFESGKPDFPFMLCWANHNWTRTWDGFEREVLLKQEHSFEDDLIHIKELIKYFKDPRYIRVNNKPFFVVCSPELFPDVNKTLEIWREIAKKEGIGDLYLAYMHSPRINYGSDMKFDAAIEFIVRGVRPNRDPLNERTAISNFIPKLSRWMRNTINRKLITRIKKERKYITYEDFISAYFKQEKLDIKTYPSIFPGWDNSARRLPDPNIIRDSSPKLFELWLNKLLTEFEPFSDEENFVFINTWNEWAEGNHLSLAENGGFLFESYEKRIVEIYRGMRNSLDSEKSQNERIIKKIH